MKPAIDWKTFTITKEDSGTLLYCPKCRSTNINEIISKGKCTDSGLAQGVKELDAYPIRPCVEFECEDCKARWDNPKYQEYLLHRAVRLT